MPKQELAAALTLQVAIRRCRRSRLLPPPLPPAAVSDWDHRRRSLTPVWCRSSRLPCPHLSSRRRTRSSGERPPAWRCRLACRFGSQRASTRVLLQVTLNSGTMLRVGRGGNAGIRLVLVRPTAASHLSLAALCADHRPQLLPGRPPRPLAHSFAPRRAQQNHNLKRVSFKGVRRRTALTDVM